MTDVARGHGGDGGNSPPHGNALRIESACESSNPRRRGRGINATILKKFEANNNQPLPLEVGITNRRFTIVGNQRSDLIRYMSNYIMSSAPMQYGGWDDVPDAYKRDMFPSLYHYFDLKSLESEDFWPKVQVCIDRECKRAYRDRKNQLKNHFVMVGGATDIERTRAIPHEAVDLDRWHEVCDLFTSEDHVKQSSRNKNNRSKHVYPSLHGSESYTQRQWKMQQQNVDYSYLDNFARVHTRDGTWIDPAARADHDRIVQESHRLSQNLAEGEQLNKHQVFENVFGHRRGYIKGVGPTIKNAPLLPSSQIVSGPSQVDWQQQFEAYKEEQQQQFQQQMENYRRQQEEIQRKQMEEFRQEMDRYMQQQQEVQRKMWQDSGRYNQGSSGRQNNDFSDE